MTNNNKTVLITGATGYIGREIVKNFLANRFIVYGHNRNGFFRCSLVEPKIKNELSSSLDVTDEDNSFGFEFGFGFHFEFINEAKIGNLIYNVDILINALGGAGEHQCWEETSVSKWSEVFYSNTILPFQIASKTIPFMKERKWGRIINIASVAATKPLAVGPEYSAAKAACLSATISLAKSVARSGITVNCISPGLVSTVGVINMIKKKYGVDFINVDDFNSFVSNHVFSSITGKLTLVNEILAVIDLLSGIFSDNITAQNIIIDGGYSVL